MSGPGAGKSTFMSFMRSLFRQVLRRHLEFGSTLVGSERRSVWVVLFFL